MKCVEDQPRCEERHAGAYTNFDSSGVYQAIPAGAGYEFLPAEDKNDSTTGSATDGDVCIMTIDLT